MVDDWQAYQEAVKRVFQELGVDARTNERVEGVRTSHNVDVTVRSQHVGFQVFWLVECKFWNHPVSKLHVLGLRQIVQDTGADRGILLSESGFQSGSVEAARLTNVRLASLTELKKVATQEVSMMRIRDLQVRLQECRERYWKIDKTDRIELGLRPDVGQAGYSARHVMDSIEEALRQALIGRYPVRPDHLLNRMGLGIGGETPPELLDQTETAIGDLERRLDMAESSLPP